MSEIHRDTFGRKPVAHHPQEPILSAHITPGRNSHTHMTLFIYHPLGRL